MRAVRNARFRKLLGKSLTVLGYNLSHAAEWQSASTLRADLARRLAGRGASPVFDHAIKAGRDNLHLHVYACAPDAGAPRFVEKRSRNLGEYKAARILAGRAASPVLPAIHAVALGASSYTVFMEHIAQAGRFTPRPKLARPLAEALWQLNRDARTWPDHPRLTTPLPWFAQLGDGLRAHLLQDLAVTERDLARLCAALRDVPRVMCHNDLNPPNILVTRSGDAEILRFVDFGRIAPNRLGADLHGLADLAEARHAGDGFLEETARAYGELCDRPPRDLLLAAYLYAASVRLNRAINAQDAHPFDGAARLVLKAFEWL